MTLTPSPAASSHIMTSPPGAAPDQPEPASGRADEDLVGVAIETAREAAIVAFAQVLDDHPGAEAPEVRLMLTATRGNPSQAHSETEVRFASPNGLATSHHDKVAIALASMKAIAPELYTTMMAGLDRGRRVSFGGLGKWLRPGAR
jgi:hypothetical protein